MTVKNVVREGMASRTALRAAILRAAHQLLDEPTILDDPVALDILDQEVRDDLSKDPFQYNDAVYRALRAAIVVRSKVAEDELARAVELGVGQYVVLGAGLDTFAYRNPFAALRVYEVDHPATQDWKRGLLGEAGIDVPANLSFTAVDFESSRLDESLAEAGFRTDLPACFSWLGVTMYLSEHGIMDTLKFVATMPARSSITFDFRILASIKEPAIREISEAVARRAKALGEPWLSAFAPEDLRDKVLGLGFRQAIIYGPETLNERYLHRRKDRLWTNSHILSARV